MHVIHRRILSTFVASLIASASATALAEPIELVAAARPEPSLPKWTIPLTLVGVYGGLTAYAYAAWYNRNPQQPFHFGGDGFFGADTYAGGADKLGHAWMNCIFTRLPTEMMVAAGWRRLPSSLVAGGLSMAAYTLMEVKDGYYFEFSTSDLVFDAVGVGLGIALENVPALDRLVDFRMSYLPSREWKSQLDQDYAGETYMLALKLGGIPPLRNSAALSWIRFFDVTVGFNVNFLESAMPGEQQRQHLFLGMALDLQEVIDDVGRGRLRAVGHAAFEHVSLPYTYVDLVSANRTRR